MTVKKNRKCPMSCRSQISTLQTRNQTRKNTDSVLIPSSGTLSRRNERQWEGGDDWKKNSHTNELFCVYVNAHVKWEKKEMKKNHKTCPENGNNVKEMVGFSVFFSILAIERFFLHHLRFFLLFQRFVGISSQHNHSMCVCRCVFLRRQYCR